MFGYNPKYPLLNACLNWQNDSVPFILYGISDGFKKAGDDVVKQIVTDEGRDIDKKIFPMVYLYRHFIESALKELIELCLIVQEKSGKYIERPMKNHKISDLLTFLHEIVPIKDMILPEESQKIILDFDTLDTGSMNFRYATRRDDSIIKHPTDYINIIDLYNQIDTVYKDFDALRNMFDGYEEFL